MGVLKEIFSEGIYWDGGHADVLQEQPPDEENEKGFDPEQHPRDEHGKFSESAGGSAAGDVPECPAVTSPECPFGSDPGGDAYLRNLDQLEKTLQEDYVDNMMREHQAYRDMHGGSSEEEEKAYRRLMQGHAEREVRVGTHSDGSIVTTEETRQLMKSRVCEGIAADMGAKLSEDEVPTQAIRDFLVGRGKMNEGERENATRPALLSETAKVLVHTWAESASDSEPLSLALQETVRKRFGCDGAANEMADAGESTREKAKDIQVTKQPILEAFVDSVYERTQDQLKTAGIRELTIYRGMHFLKIDEPEWVEKARDSGAKVAVRGMGGSEEAADARINGNAAIVQNPLSSYAQDYKTASYFAHDEEVRAVLALKVPAERIFSTSFTGIGCLTENEVVVVAPNHFRVASDPYDRARMIVFGRGANPRDDEFWQSKQQAEKAKHAAPPFVVTVDGDLANSDWPKRTDDKLEPGVPSLKSHDVSDQPRDHGKFAEKPGDGKKEEEEAGPEKPELPPSEAPKDRGDNTGYWNEIEKLEDKLYDIRMEELEKEPGQFWGEAEKSEKAHRDVKITIEESGTQATDAARRIVKNEIAKAVGEKMVEKLTASSGDEGKTWTDLVGFLANANVAGRSVNNIHDIHELANVAADALVRQWASSSSDSQPLSLALQETVRKKFGCESAGDPLKPADEYLKADTKKILDQHSKVLDAFVDATYENTQKRLSDLGVKELTLYRGLHFQDDAPGWVTAAVDSDNATDIGPAGQWRTKLNDKCEIQTNPLSSFTTSYVTAAEFASQDEHRIVCACKVPASRVFSFPTTGLGCLIEDEVVVVSPNKFKGSHGGNDNARTAIFTEGRTPAEAEFWTDPALWKSKSPAKKVVVAYLDEEQHNADWPKKTDDVNLGMASGTAAEKAAKTNPYIDLNAIEAGQPHWLSGEAAKRKPKPKPKRKPRPKQGN